MQTIFLMGECLEINLQVEAVFRLLDGLAVELQGAVPVGEGRHTHL
jgi:hypothetical protein